MLLQFAHKLSQILHLVIRRRLSCSSGWQQFLPQECRWLLSVLRASGDSAARCSAICNFLSVVFSASASAGVSRSALSSVVAFLKLFRPTASETRRAVIWFAAALRSWHRAPAPRSLPISLFAATTRLPAETSTCHAHLDGDLRWVAQVVWCGTVWTY